MTEATAATRDELIASGVITSPREPTVTERRRIMEELEARYDLKRCCYLDADTDKSVADRLAVPRAWVRDIRAQFFGDLNVSEAEHGLAEDIRGALVEVRSLKGRLGQLEGKIDELAQRAQKLLAGSRR